MKTKGQETKYLNLDCRNLICHDAKLYNLLTRYPQEMIPVFDYSATEVYQNLFEDEMNEEEEENFAGVRVRPFNLDNDVNMRELDPSG